jgi:hypothetical protein
MHIPKERGRILPWLLLAILMAAIVAPVLQLAAATKVPFGCADYVCQYDLQCQRITGCKACSGIRCSDVQ